MDSRRVEAELGVSDAALPSLMSAPDDPQTGASQLTSRQFSAAQRAQVQVRPRLAGFQTRVFVFPQAADLCTVGTDIWAAKAAYCTYPKPSLEPGTQDAIEMCTPLLFSDSAVTGSDCDLKEQLTAATPLDPPSLLKRRAAKRDSAQRIRAKNKDLLNSLACEMNELTASNSRLTEDSIEVDNDVAHLSAHLSATRTRTLHTTSLSEQLTQELQMLQRAARPNTRAHGQRRLAVTSQATHEVTDPPVIVLGGTGRVKREGSLNAARNRALAAGLALVASVPLVLSGSANAFVGNTAKDFSDKVEQVTPDVPLPGLKQKGKEAEAIGKLKGPQSGPGAADQLPIPEAVPSKESLAQAKDTVTDGDLRGSLPVAFSLALENSSMGRP
ncbi:MAG: hypothetical protein FRX49_11864 [Trebouxia sp. A1-2]|nr:MAG: hypothetical protein FRX49_11864 [Trebouxia sp. A1-2]